MNRLCILAVLALVAAPQSQTVAWKKKFAKPISGASVILMQVIDIDDVKHDGYIASSAKSGLISSDSALFAWDILTGNIEFNGKIPAISGAQSSSTKMQYIYIMKNLFSSNGKWSILRLYFNPNSEVVLDIYDNNKSVFNATFQSTPSFYKFGTSLFMYGATSDSMNTLFKIRSDLISSITPKTNNAIANAFDIHHSNNIITITLTDPQSTVFHWQVCTVSGRLISDGLGASNGKSNASAIIDISDMPNGPHIIQATSRIASYASIINAIQKQQ